MAASERYVKSLLSRSWNNEGTAAVVTNKGRTVWAGRSQGISASCGVGPLRKTKHPERRKRHRTVHRVGGPRAAPGWASIFRQVVLQRCKGL